MSEDIKMADIEIIDHEASSHPKVILLKQELFKQKLIVTRLAKGNEKLTQQVAELRAALSEVERNITDIQDGFDISESDAELLEIVRNALLKEGE